MATACEDRLIKNIKDLPVTDVIQNGDLLIVEQDDGTYTLPFENFIITLDNTTFGSVVQANTTNIATLCADTATNFDTVYTYVNSYVDTLSTQIQSISAAVDKLNSTFIVLKSTGTAIEVLDSKNAYVPEEGFNPTTQEITILFEENFPNDYYCVSVGAYYGVAPVYLNVSNMTSNSITVRCINTSSQLTPFTRGWVRITTT